MPDHLPGRSRDDGAGRPLTPAQFRKRDLARRALDEWISTQSYARVKNKLKLRDIETARALVAEGERIWLDEESQSMTRYKKMMRDDLLRMRGLLVEAMETDEGLPRLEVIDRAVKVGERMSKLLALDEQKDEQAGGPQFVLIDTREPWNRPETHDFDGEIVEPPSLPSGDETD